MSYEIVRSRDRKNRNKALVDASLDVGSQRTRAVEALSVIGDDLAFALKYDTAVVALTGNGNEYIPPKSEEGKPARVRSDMRNVFLIGDLPGAAWANKRIGELVLPCGVCLIVGAGGVGKSPLAQALASFGREDFAVVRVGEPLAGYTSDNVTSARGLAAALHASPDVVLDSIKDLLSSGTGAAMKSGISRTALSSLAAWSALACDLGSTIYIPVNPSTKDPETMELLAEAARSNATMTIVHREGNQWQYWGRRGEGLNRSTGTLILAWDADGSAKVQVDGRTVSEVSELNAGISIARKLVDWDGVTRRSLLSVGAQNDLDSE